MSHALTLEDLIQETKVTDAQLGLKCTVEHLRELAPSVRNYPKFASEFNLSGGDLSDIETDLKLSYTSKTEQVFLWWHNNTKNPTYLTFVQSCLYLNEGGLAHKMCLLCQGSLPKKWQSIVLTQDDFLTIVDKLKSASKDWLKLGLALGMSYWKLENIQDQYSNDNHRLAEMVGQCLDSKHVTWHYICECLRTPNVQRNDVAEEIEALGPFDVNESPSESASTSLQSGSKKEDMQMFCTIEGDKLDPADDSNIPTDAQGGVVRYHLLWDVEQISELKVHFLNPDILEKEHWKCGHAGPLTVNNVLDWATVWNSHADNYPQIAYELATREKAHIRVEFRRKGISSWSNVGTAATWRTDKNKPTMVLNLYGMAKTDQRSMVIHSFGHVLGLDHQHQRSDFWDVLESKDEDNQYRFIIGIDRMKSGDGGNCMKASDAVFRAKLEEPLGSQQSSYDPDSIMHYWFDKNWLLPEYRKRSNVAKHVTDERERKMLLGVHHRDYRNGQLAENPSKLDYETLNRAYGKRYTERSSFVFLIQPKDVCCKPGDKAEFSVSTSLSDRSTHTWYCNDQTISHPDGQTLLPEYEGQKSERLLILKVLPKHKGVYSCIAEDESGTRITSKRVALTAEGEKIEKQELQFIGKILENSSIDFGKDGIETVDLLSGEGDVTYEEMEFVMKKNPKTQVLSINLKQEITSRLKEEQLYDEAIKFKGKVSLTYTKILALGPGQVGKSTFISRLFGKMEGNIQTSPPETQPQSSTGISEVTEACIQLASIPGRTEDLVKEASIQCSTITGAVATNNKTGAVTKKWCVVKDELCDQLGGLMSLIVKCPRHKSSQLSKQSGVQEIPKTNKVQAVEESVVEEQKHDYSFSNKGIEIPSMAAVTRPSSTQEPRHYSLIPQDSDINKTMKDFQELKEEWSHRLDLDSMDFEMLFTVSDVGGQPAFLEMLPSLTIGPALYLVFMKLKQDLTFRSRVEFKPKDSSTINFDNYSYTSEEVIFTALSSIACFGHSDEQVEKYVKPVSDEKNRKDSVVLLVGTFLDEIQIDLQLNLDKINRQLEERLKNTAFFDEGLVHRIKMSKEDSLLVNNLSAEEGEIEKHRDLLEKILKKNFREYEIPAQWLMLSICLKLLARNQKKYHISIDDCVKLGKHFDMDANMVSVALQFLHKYIGLVMYFPHHKNLKNIVICDPQLVFSTVSELIFNIYDHNKDQVSEAKCDRFKQTGCFSPKDIQLEPVHQENNKLLSIETLVDLLVYLHIAAEVPLSSDRDTLEYFLPAVLQTAERDMERRKKDINEELLPEPICIRFKTGYLPLGFVCALSANLIAENKFDLLIGESKCYKNKILFRFDGKFDITVISCPRYCEFRVLRHSPGNTEFWSEDCCPLIKEIVCTAANKVIQSMQHGLRSIGTDSEMYKLAFHCRSEVHSKAEFGQESLATFCHSDKDTHVPKAKCTHPDCKTAIDPLPPEMSVWFGEHPSISLNIKKQPARKGNVVTIIANGLRPLTYEWFLGKKKLCDNDDQDPDYDGYTTNKLVIKNDLFLTEGVLKCKVKDKSECVVESDELDLFEEELRNTWKLQEEEIGKIKDNGFKSVRNLQGVQLNKLESLFNMAEKIRMKPLLDFLRNAAISAPPQSQRTPLSHHTDAGRCVGVVNEIARLHDVVKQAGIGGDILRADKPQSVKADAPSPKRTKETVLQQQQQQQQPSLKLAMSSARYWNINEYKVQDKAGCGVLVAVLDTGINVDHYAFQDKDKIKFGKNFVTEESRPCQNPSYLDQDPSAHGTGVASVIAGKRISGNHPSLRFMSQSDYKLLESLPVGVASKASLVVCRVATTCTIAPVECVAEALKWIHEHNDVVMKYDPEKQKGDSYCNDHKKGCKLSHEDKKKDKISIVNMSFILRDDHSKIEQLILDLKIQKVICVAGFGNDGNNRSPGYPALYTNVFSVGAVDSDGQVAGFSTSCKEHVDVCALGKGVLVACNSTTFINSRFPSTERPPPQGSPVHLSIEQQPHPGPLPNTECTPPLPPPPPPPPPPPLPATQHSSHLFDVSFKCVDGTSFATPAVSGLIAILLQRAREQEKDEFPLAEHISDINILRKLFKKHLVEPGLQPGLNLIQPERMNQFFESNIKHLEVVIKDLLAAKK